MFSTQAPTGHLGRIVFDSPDGRATVVVAGFQRVSIAFFCLPRDTLGVQQRAVASARAVHLNTVALSTGWLSYPKPPITFDSFRGGLNQPGLCLGRLSTT